MSARSCNHTLRADISSLLTARVWWVRLTARVDRGTFPPTSSIGMMPVSVQLRPSSEHIPIVRAPGAKDRCGRHSNSPSSESTGTIQAPIPFSIFCYER